MSTSKVAGSVLGVIAILATAILFRQTHRLAESEAALLVMRQERNALARQLASMEERARRAEKWVAEAETDSGELLKAIETYRVQAPKANPGAPSYQAYLAYQASQERLGYERLFQQELAKRRSEAARSKAKIADEVSRLDAVHKYGRLLELAAQLAGSADYQSAIRFFNEAMKAKPAEVPVSDETSQLQSRLTAQNKAVEVSIRSDGQTYCMIPGYRFLGTGNFSVKFMPGDYEVEGMRQGYENVRVPLRVRAGELPPQIAVVCTVPAKQ